jgi:hypothetical protein
MSQASPVTSANLDALPTQLQQAISTLDLEPNRELERYRLYKGGSPESARTAQMNGNGLERPSIDITEEEEEEDYEMIPPSQPFAVLEEEPQRLPQVAAGELVLSSHLHEDESLDLSFVSPGEITQSHNEYLPASKELWRSLGQPDPATVAPEPKSKWRLPVAIGSSIVALTAVTGMTYVNTHPALLKTVPMVAQLTAPPAPVQIPPGQALQGPDLAMGEFSDLTLANLNSIVLPGSAEPIAAAPAPVVPTAAAVSAAPAKPNVVVTAPVPVNAQTSASAVAPVVPAPAPSNSPSLADSLIRNLLPANIQQMNARPEAAPKAATKPAETAKPYTPANTMSFQPQGGANGYRVVTEYNSPKIFSKIQALVPKATIAGNSIDLGNFKNKSEAEAVIKRLAQKGFVARLL